jgi:hypothetical protein
MRYLLGCHIYLITIVVFGLITFPRITSLSAAVLPAVSRASSSLKLPALLNNS